jgi:hypothetical protein
MTDLLTAEWVVASVLFAALGLYTLWLIAHASSDRLMRCPRTGGIALVGVLSVASRGGHDRQPVVHRCSLWPENHGCGQGCLARYRETGSGLRINAVALRPFERS